MEKSLVKKEPPNLKKLALAAELGKKGDYTQAVKVLRSLISGTDAPPEAWLLLGRSLHALKDYSRALAAFNDFLQQRPDSGEGYLFTGRTYLTLGLPYKAVPFLRKALENSPGDSRIKALLGTAYLRSKHSQAAVQTLEEAVEAAPEDKRIYRAYLNSLLVRGIRLCGIEDYDLGLQMLRFVLQNGSDSGIADNPFLRLELGRAARESGRLEEALEHFTAALNLSKDGASKSGADGDRRIRWSRASILMALGRTAEAGMEIEKIRSHDADVPELPWNSELVDLFLIRSFIESGEWRRAGESCRAWLRTREGGGPSQSRPIIHALYAEAMRNLRNYKAAHNHLQRALEEEPDELEFWYADILVSWEGKDFKSLKRAIKAARSLGGDEDIIRRFEILSRVQTTDDTMNNLTMLQKAIRSLGPEPELMHALAETYLKVGLLEEAESWYNKTKVVKKDHEGAWLGEIAAVEAILNTEKPKGRGKGALPQRKKNSGRQEEGVQKLGSLYSAYLERWPDNSNILRDRALFLVRTFEYAEAASELEKLLVWEPSNPSLRRVLAYTYRKTGRYQEAAVFLKALLKEKPLDIGLLIEYSGCLERAGGEKYAVAVLEKARELFHTTTVKPQPRNSELADLSLALGILKFRQKNVEKAFDYLREASSLSPKDPRSYEWMAVIANKIGDKGNSVYYKKEAEKRKKSRA